VKIKTTRFGEIDLKKDQLIQMPHGMLGFYDSQRFVIIQHTENSPFCWYQSLDDPDLAFVITNPYIFMPDYNPKLKDALTHMNWQMDEERYVKTLEIYVVVNIPRGAPQNMTGNFMGPLVINPHCRQGIQVILSDGVYSHKTRLMCQNTQKVQEKDKQKVSA